jgi:hypothetical protein
LEKGMMRLKFVGSFPAGYKPGNSSGTWIKLKRSSNPFQHSQMFKNPRPPTKVSSGSARNDGDGNHIQNLILLGLSQKECEMLFAKLEFVRSKLHQVLYEAGDTIKSGYFVNSGMMSVLAVQPDGKSVEVGFRAIKP